jgi:hypothetical protein
MACCEDLEDGGKVETFPLDEMMKWIWKEKDMRIRSGLLTTENNPSDP